MALPRSQGVNTNLDIGPHIRVPKSGQPQYQILDQNFRQNCETCGHKTYRICQKYQNPMCKKEEIIFEDLALAA